MLQNDTTTTDSGGNTVPGGGSNNTGAVVGGVIVCLLLLAVAVAIAIVLVILHVLQRRRQAGQEKIYSTGSRHYEMQSSVGSVNGKSIGDTNDDTYVSLNSLIIIIIKTALNEIINFIAPSPTS